MAKTPVGAKVRHSNLPRRDSSSIVSRDYFISLLIDGIASSEGEAPHHHMISQSGGINLSREEDLRAAKLID